MSALTTALDDGHVCRQAGAVVVPAMPEAISTAVQMPTPGRHVLMWEVRAARWSIGSWCPRFQQWSNRDDPEYAIHPEHISHWMLLPNAMAMEAVTSDSTAIRLPAV
jgi:hypothetical protein